jgi:DNA-binding NarL/FixJ family response regulator
MAVVRAPRRSRRPPSRRFRRVLVVDDHPLTRAGVAALLNHEPGVRVCCQVGSVAEALAAVRRSRPDLVLTDLEMGPRSGMELVRRLHAERPRMPVIVFSMHYGSIYADRALRAGASGYVMKSEGPGRLLEAVRQALQAADLPEAPRRSAAPCTRRRRSPSSSP